MTKDLAQKNRKVAMVAGGAALAMLGLAYASAPLYKIFCEATGFGGTTQRAASAPAQQSERMISIRFDSNVSPDLAWNFRAETTSMSVKIGEVAIARYLARNDTSGTETGTAVFNVTPPQAGVFFNKIECFCFIEQTLKPGEQAELPVQFFVDPAILDDPDTRNIHEITLSYTFYPANKTPANKQAALPSN